jgi:hypothetical protein
MRKYEVKQQKTAKGLFIDAVSIKDCTASNYMVTEG